MNKEKIISKLKALKIDWVEGICTPTVIESDGDILVSAEDGKCLADYYGEFLGGYPWVHPALEAFAEKHNMFWEWKNPGCISLHLK